MIRPTNRYSGPPRGSGALPHPVTALLARTGGIVATRELRRLGVDATAIEILRDYGSLQAVRQGWHCTPATPSVIRLAWRFGGPLACVSALAFHDAWTPLDAHETARHGPRELAGIDEPLHICLRSGAFPPPSPALLIARWGGPEPQPPVIHWSSRDYVSGDRRAVSRDVALRQAMRCRAIAAEPPSAAED